jgi:hypothetical protein
MRHPVPGGQVIRLTDPDAEAVDPAPAGPHQDRALLSDEPCSQSAALQGQTGPLEQLALLVTEQVPEQAKRGPLGRMQWRAAMRCVRFPDRFHAPSPASGLKVEHGDPVSQEDR